MSMSQSSVFRSVGMMALVLSVAATADGRSESEQAFDRLASLQGEWEGEQRGTKMKGTYTLTANGSTLMEEVRPETGPVMITMFTVDGDHLIATHYCSARNQPQMVTSPVTDAHKPLAFTLACITALKSPADWHNTGLTVIQEDNNHLSQEWTYESEGKIGKTVFHYTRIQR